MIEYVSVEPNWAKLFEFAKQVAVSQIKENKGRGIVVEMLNYGALLLKEKKGEVTE